MKERIKKLRKKCGLSQEVFGKRIGIGKTSVSKLENGENNPSEQTIILLCKEFGVNEVWLRTGEGGDENMFTKIDEDDRYALNLGKLTLTQNQTVKNLINAIAETAPDKLKDIEEFMKLCLGIK